jgi:predicted NBD/HSP70 family sugar kinase
VNLAALGERWHGLGRDVDEFVYLHIGTGVGLGIVMHGELYRGAGGAAGEVGYLPLWGTDVRAPASRKRGALDRAASAGGVVDAAKQAGMTGPLTGKRIFGAARDGDRVAKRVVAQEADRVAMTIAAVAAVLDPALVILGGGIGGNAELLLEPVRDRVRELSPFRPAIEASELREEATLHGSVSMALQAAHARLFDRSATA